MSFFLPRLHPPSSAPKTTTLIISNDQMKDIIEIVKAAEDSGVLLKGVSETIQNETKKQKGGFLSMLLGTLGASLLVNILEEKGVISKSISEETTWTSQGQRVNRAGEGPIAKRQGRGIGRAGYRNKKVRKTTTKHKKNF